MDIAGYTDTLDCVNYDDLPAKVTAGSPVNLLFSVNPAHPSNQIIVYHTLNGQPMSAVRTQAVVNGSPDEPQRFRASMPCLNEDDIAEYSPVVRRAGLTVTQLPERCTRGQRIPVTTHKEAPVDATASARRFAWTTEFLGAFTVTLVNPPQYIGPGPDGLRINYFIDYGEIRGPRLNGTVSGGDWMSLRPDGIGEAESRITYQTDDGARILSRYTGIFDLGHDGYERAKRNEFDRFPPLVMTPTFTTSHPDWLWLNRLQCLAVGRAQMDDLTVYLDIHAVRTGMPLSTPNFPAHNREC